MVIDRRPVRYAHCDGHTDVCYSERGTSLLTCGSDGDLRIWDGFDDDDPIQTCVGDSNLCIRQKFDEIYVATDSNNIQILSYPEAQRCGVLVRFTAHVNHIAIGKNNLIIAASENMEVKIIKRTANDDENEVNSFCELKGPPLSVALCPKSKYLAISCGDGNLFIWEVETKKLIKSLDVVPKANSFMNAKSLCRIDFDPLEGRMLAYPSENKIIILNTSDWTEKFTLTTSDVDSTFSIVQFSPCGKFLAAASLSGDIVVWEVFSQSLVGVSRHSKPIPLCALMWNPKGNGEMAFCDIEGQLGIASNCNSVEAVQKEREEIVSEVTSVDQENETEVDFSGYNFEDDDDDENTISISKLKNDIMGPIEPELASLKSSRSSTPRPRTPEIPLQASFMPTSTPEHLSPRYLCWNEVGIIQSYGSEDLGENKTIEIVFHDISFHNSIMMPNFQDYMMGCLSTAVVCVANSTQMNVLILTSGSTEWNQSVSDPEEIVCCACSDRLVCYATNTYLVRVSTVFGTQKAVFAVPGPVVCMNARGDTILVAYHRGAMRKNDMCLGILQVNFSGLLPVSKDLNCPLSPESTLQWIGVSDCGSPAVQDSLGILSLFVGNSNLWVPFCDTTKQVINVSDGFFVTAVFESTQSVRGIRCKGSMYPGFLPRPAQTEIPLKAAFGELDTEKSQLEESLFTWSSLIVNNVERKYKENAIKLFSLACQNDLQQRAYELMSMLNNPQLITIATKYANNLDKNRLAEKLSILASTLRRSASDVETKEKSTNRSEPIQESSQKEIVLSQVIRSNVNFKYKQRLKKKLIDKNKETVVKSGENSQNFDKTDSQEYNINSTNTTIDGDTTYESSVCEDSPKNPFLKKANKNTTNNKDKENENLENKPSEKRKQTDLDSSKDENGKPKEKQRKLDFFKFSKT